MEKKKTITYILKYAGISIAAGILYGFINYFKNGIVDLAYIAISSLALFLLLCFLAFITPPLRKLLGYKDAI